MAKQQLVGKVAVITGASAGIGRAAALALAQGGADVVLTARNPALLAEVEAEIKAQPGRRALPVLTDVTDQGQVQALINKTLSCFGRVDLLISNAGQYIRSPVSSLSLHELENSIAVNFYSHVYAALAALPHMQKQRSGHLLLVSTMDARKPLPLDAPYASAKAAASAFWEILRQEARPYGVAVTTIYPGRVDTAMIASLQVPWISAKMPVSRVTRAILHAIEHRPAEMILPPQAVLLHLLNVFAPRLADAAVRWFKLEGW